MHIIVHVLVNILWQLRINHSSYNSWLLYMFKFVVFNSCYTCNRHHLHLLIFILVCMFIFIFIIMFIRFTFVLKLICILILAFVLIPYMHTYICTHIHARTYMQIHTFVPIREHDPRGSLTMVSYLFERKHAYIQYSYTHSSLFSNLCIIHYYIRSFVCIIRFFKSVYISSFINII